MKRVLALSTSLIALSITSVALADDPSPSPSPSADPQPVAGGTEPLGAPPSLDKPAGEEPKKEETEDRWRASLDVMFGFGATPVVSQRIVGPLLTNESRTAESARFATQSFNLGLEYELFKNFEVGALMPLGTGNVYPNETRGSSVVGNFTLGGAYTAHVSQALAVKLGVEVALPTASGDQLPESSTLGTSGHLNQTDLDRYSLLKAMSDSRGREDTASFSSNHLGLVPMIGAKYVMSEKVELGGYAKYESLHATADEAKYEGAIVVAGRATYHFSKTFDGTLRVWTNIPVAGDDSAIAAAEPQIAAHLGWVTPMVGVVLPFAGEITNPYVVGVRAALAARF